MVRDPMLKAFLLTLEPGKSYEYVDIMAMMPAFIEGWKAGEAHAAAATVHVTGISAPKRRSWSLAQREKYRHTLARKSKKGKR